MKVALCFIISYEHKLNKEQLWIDWIKPNKDIINVYFHYKDFNKIKSPWIKMYALPKNMIQETSYYNVVPAYISTMTYAYEHDKENVWFCMLTDSCVPIVSPEKFKEMFFNNFQASIMTCKPAYWDIKLHRRSNLRLLDKEYWLANDPWFTLCRNHVQKCLLFLTMKTKIYKQINMGGLANESIFAIILQTFGELTNSCRLINYASSIADWHRMSSPTSPYVFKEGTKENIEIISELLKNNKYAMFLRKVDKSFPNSVLLELMNTDYGHIYDTSYNHATNKKENISINSIKLFMAFLLFIYGCTYIYCFHLVPHAKHVMKSVIGSSLDLVCIA